MKNDMKSLYGAPQEFIIGKDLPEGQQRTIFMKALEANDMDMADIDDNAPLTEQKEQLFKMIAKMMDCSVEEVRPIAIPYLKDIAEAVGTVNNIKTEDKDKMQNLLLEKKNQVLASRR